MPSLLVTGGSRGIGAAIVRQAAAAGHDVAYTYLQDPGAGPGRAIQADVALEDDVLRVFAEADRQFGQLDAVVINAGITGRFSRVDELDAATIERVLAVNVTGAFLCAREAVRRMSNAHGGRGGAVVAISSRAAGLGSPGEYVHYAASKAALDTMVRGLAKEVAREGIRVNGVAPGLIDTEIHARAGRPERPAAIAPLVPMGRIGTPDEVAAAALWLLSPAATYVTGAILDVSGGR